MTQIKFDEIGIWSEIKLEIIKEYAKAYSLILTKQFGLKHYYIDAFSGAGLHFSRTSKGMVPGSPMNALNVDPRFKHYWFIDLDGKKIEYLREMMKEQIEVECLEGDCNDLLLNEVFPNVLYKDFRRALCLLDPYGLHLDWQVIKTAGQMKSIEIFLNFPVADINRNTLWHDLTGVSEEQKGRMTRFWGDETWLDVAYDKTRDLFGHPEKTENEVIAEAFRERLKKVAGFKFVPAPIPMRNKNNAIVYYLFFASHNSTGEEIVKDIFDKFGDSKGK